MISSLRISTPKLTQYVQKNTHFKTYFRVYILLIINKIPITHTQSMFLLFKLFTMAIDSICYFCDVMGLYADKWKLMFFFCPNQFGHYIIYFS